jgi:glucosamine-6-phosphate deaminase
MDLIIAETYDELSVMAAQAVIDFLIPRSNALVVLPSGNTPLGMYRELIQFNGKGRIDFGKSRFVQLDEYIDISKDDHRNLFRWIDKVFFTPAGISEDQVIRFNSMADDVTDEAQRVENAISEAGGITLQILGLGPNGHLGFNEPGTGFHAKTHAVELSPASITSNARYWGNPDRVPRKAFTLGLGTLREAEKTILLVSSRSKSNILADVLEGPVGPDVPASILRLMENVTFMADREAVGCLSPKTSVES